MDQKELQEWLPKAVKDYVTDALRRFAHPPQSATEKALQQKQYTHLSNIWTAFTNKSFLPFWEKLERKNEARNFLIELLIQVPDSYNHFSEWFETKYVLEESLQSLESVQATLERVNKNLYRSIDGQKITNLHDALYSVKKEIYRVEQAMKSNVFKGKEVGIMHEEYVPYARENNQRVFYQRSLSYWLRTKIGKPHHKELADILSLLFRDEKIDENTIAANTRTTRKFIQSQKSKTED